MDRTSRGSSAVLRLGLIVLVAAICGFAAPSARALEFDVSTTADPANNALCLPGDCSLRQAVNASNLLPLGDQINVPAGTYTLDPGFGPLFMLLGAVTLSGQGPGQTVLSGGGATGVLVTAGDSSPTINGVTISGGASVIGGAIVHASGEPAVLTNVAVSGNRADAGGGLYQSGGSLTVTDSTVSGNTAQASASNGGGGIYGLLASVTLSNSTVSGNTAAGPGGGIQTIDSLLDVTSSTIAANSAASGGNIAASGIVGYTNSIVSGGSAATGSNCAGTALVLTSGRSLDSISQCGMGVYDMKGIDPQLGPLGANGGPTATMAPALTSPVIDAGLACPPPGADQRGVARPQGAACDIGAVEQALPAPAAVTPAVQNMKLSASTFAASDSGTSMIARKRRSIGTVVSYTSPALASVRFSVQRKWRGKYKTVNGSFTDDGNKGPNSFRFSGRMAGRKLKPGKYRLVAVPTDAAGRKGAAVRRGFRITRR